MGWRIAAMTHRRHQRTEAATFWYDSRDMVIALTHFRGRDHIMARLSLSTASRSTKWGAALATVATAGTLTLAPLAAMAETRIETVLGTVTRSDPIKTS